MEEDILKASTSKMVNFYKSDDDSSDNEQDEKPKKARKDLSKLPVHLKGLMGEANLRYARGDLETAKKMCFEVIRQAPDAYEPYLTLSQMYENTNMKKYKAYLMLASHLVPNNITTTCRLAELCIQDGDIDEAIKCYSRAIKYNAQSYFLHEMRLELLQQKGDEKNILAAKQTMANNIEKIHAEQIANLAMEVAKEHYKNENYVRAIEALRIPIKRIPEHVTQDIINIILELLLIKERYSDCLDIFTQFCGFVFDVTLTEENAIIVNSYKIPENVAIDIQIKFISCLIKLQASHLFPELIDKMLIALDVETLGDLYLDIVESLMYVSYHEEALKLLIPLVKSKAYSLAAVWLKYAECLASCNLIEQAIDAYLTVRNLAPGHVEVLYPLAMLLLKQNKTDEALKVMSQDFNTNKLDVAVLLEQMKLLKQMNHWENYWKCAELLLSGHCILPKHPEELKMVMTKDRYLEKVVKVKKLRNFRNDDTNVECTFEIIREPSREEEYNIYKNILQLALDKQEYSHFQKFAFMGLSSKHFQNYVGDIYIIAAFSCLLRGDSSHGYILLKDILIKYPNNNLVWNWFSIITASSDDLRFPRFLEKLRHVLVSENREMILANHNLCIGNYIQSINYFLKSFKSTRSVFSAFMLGIAMLQYHSHRNIDKSKKKLMAETVTYLFLNYSKLRHKLAEQEVYYNLGRMYHQLGVMYLAEFYYNRVFEVQNEYLEKYPEILCLKKEAAFNLHVIYKNSGNFIAARNILYKHVVI